MSIFRRRAAGPAAPTNPEPIEPELEESTADDVDDVDAPSDRSAGPFDATEVDGVGERLDLGSVWLAPVPGAELRLEVDQASESVSGIQVVIGESAAQVQVFAAPRSGGVWREIRGEIGAAINDAGGTVDEVGGAFGPELHVRMPQVGPDGRTVFAPARFVGIDGPRWFLRAVLSGQAAVDDDVAGQLTEALRAMVIHRGTDPMAPREMLPLRLPEAPAPAPEAADDGGPDEGDPGDTDRGDRYADPDLNPFERGPEITEVR